MTETTKNADIEAAIRSASRDTLAQMRALIDWARLVCLSFRALAADRLDSVHAAAAYSGCPARAASSLRATL